MKVYLLSGQSMVDYEGSYDWYCGVFSTEAKAEAVKRKYELAVREVKRRVRNRFKKDDELKKTDPACSGWGDDPPEYTITELEVDEIAE